MHVRLLRPVAVFLLLFCAVPEGLGQKKTKKNSAPDYHLKETHHTKSKPKKHSEPQVDMANARPTEVPIPQEQSLKPELKKTPKVVIVPAPPPPPGKDPVPPYPKH